MSECRLNNQDDGLTLVLILKILRCVHPKDIALCAF